MRLYRFILNSFLFYRRKNLLLALGVAISGAVLTGALVVGDSVEYSLNRIVEHRLGNITHVWRAKERYFSASLAGHVAEQLQIPVSSLLLEEGSAVAGGGKRRVSHIQVLGVDKEFDRLAGVQDFYSGLAGDSVIISRNLANRLALSTGDEFLLRIRRASLIPRNAPFVSDAGNVVSFRAIIRDIADDHMLGRFNLKVSQTAPFNVFVSLSRMEDLMDFSGRVNVMLLQEGEGPAGEQAGTEQAGTEQIDRAIREHFSAADAGLKLSVLQELQLLEVKSERVFIDEVLSEPLSRASEKAEGILTYFVNRLVSGNNTTPYSFVSTVPAQELQKDEILINRWLAEDLSVKTGDSVRMTYFVVGPLRELKEDSTTFVVKAIVPMEGRYGDRTLMPDIPGLADAGNCRDWETGVPISLESIRDKDEDYWDRYRGLPKAFISLERGKALWKNRFGTYTAFRYGMEGDRPGESALSRLEESLMEAIDPASLGFKLEDTRAAGLHAAGSGVDFSQLFGGLSFFLLVAGILLSILLFLLNLESREEQTGTMVTLGIPVRIVRRIILTESMGVALVGALTGLLLAVLYTRLVFMALNGVWSDVVRTDMMHLDVKGSTLLTGLLMTLAIAFLGIWFPLNRKLKRQFTSHIRHRDKGLFSGRKRAGRFAGMIAVATGVAALGLIISQLVRLEVVNIPVFFSAGGLLLVSAVSFFQWYLVQHKSGRGRSFDMLQLSRLNVRRNRVRSMSIVILFAIGAFLVISTGSNRKDLFTGSGDKSSGTGGFLYFAESTVPVLKQLNNHDVRYEYGLSEGYDFVQLRKADGDDASCLNLNKVANPQVLGVDPGSLAGRFSFVTRTPYLDETNPWMSLKQELAGGLIPAIADETVIKWGLGLKVGDTLHYINSGGGSMELLLIGGLAPSVFQGNVMIDNGRFLEQFPENSGTYLFLIDGEMADTALISSELERGMRDLGWDMELAATRLAEFNSVTNAYLSIFLVLGALGLLVGTFGLVVVLSRSIMERKREIALLKAVGFQRKDIRKLMVREYMILLLVGIGTGFLTAIIATLPSILNANTGTSFSSIIFWLILLVGNGWIWIHLVTRSALRNESIYTSLRNE